ncbi:hypothetical protein [Chroococcidiopsis cubana]|uniref:hypothetical protein n=1 Tax=Chroococcidiopsis cubana TaxID=171392 RepID=UPI002ACD2312|nr:hypothetical protein [Chroococcidiopsis cubana]
MHHGTNRGIQTRTISTTGQNSNSFHSVISYQLTGSRELLSREQGDKGTRGQGDRGVGEKTTHHAPRITPASTRATLPKQYIRLKQVASILITI